MNLHLHTRIALFFFLIAALLGGTLRLFALIDIPAVYRFLVHTHSHVALLGWVYVALTTLLYKLFLQNASVEKPYRRIFIFTQITIFGMLLSFPFQGYALFSIIFSTLFLISNYFFTWLFLTKTPSEKRILFSYQIIRMALFFMVFSSLSLWAMGYIMTVLGNTSIWYRLAVYFYLHFQYNGWFMLSLLGILFFVFENRKALFQKAEEKHILLLLSGSVFLTFFLSVLWLEPHWVFYALAGIGVILQFIVFIRIGKKLYIADTSVFGKTQLKLLKISGVLLIVKIILQTLSALPYFAMTAYHSLDFIIGYLHLVFLGIVSLALFAFLSQFKLLSLSKQALAIYLFAFFVTECLLFYKGICLWLKMPVIENYYLLLSLGSLLFPVGIFWMLVKHSR